MSVQGAKFIVFEGIDGSGKTTISEMLCEYFLSINVPAVKLREPTDGKYGKTIREMLGRETPPSVEELMDIFLLDREDDKKNNIVPALNSGKTIVMDRYYFSNAAYQGAMGLSPETIINENRKRGFPEPERVFLIDVDPGIAIRRISERDDAAKDFFEKKAFLEKVREIYRSIADERFLIIDGIKKPGEIIDIIKEDIRKIL